MDSPIIRTFYWVDFDREPHPEEDTVAHYQDQPEDRHRVDQESEANAVSSLMADGMHAPVIDIDLPCRLVESTTPGHFHLYIDKKMYWWQFRGILTALADAGVVEPGYVDASFSRGAAFLRLPGVEKG